MLSDIRRLHLPAGRQLSFQSLTLKPTLAFQCVGLLGAGLVALFVGLRTQHAADQFVVDQGR